MKKFTLILALLANAATAHEVPCVPTDPVVTPPLAPISTNFCPKGAQCYSKSTWNEPQRTVTLNSDQMLVVKLPVIDGSRASSRISTAGVSYNQASRKLKISTVPGDMNESGYCYRQGFEAVSLPWVTDPSNKRRYCLLTKGVQYYLNIQHTNCAAGTRCGFYLTY